MKVEEAGGDLARFCALAGPDPLGEEQVRLHAPDASLLATDGAATLARCSLWWRATAPLEGERVGFVGHYAARDASAAAALLEAASERLRREGCVRAIAPIDGSTWRRYRLVTWRAEEPRFFLEPDNPDDWPAHFERAGFRALARYHSTLCDDLGAYHCDDARDARQRAAGYRVRPIDTARIDAELSSLWRLATDAFAGNFLYQPIAEAEFRSMYAALIPRARPELISIVERGGDAVGFAFAIPDLLQAARGTAVDTVVFKTMGIASALKSHGLGGWLGDLTFARARQLGFRRGIHALMHEENVSRRIGHGQLREIRRYTLFARPL